jgi:hypothetical protein
MPRPREAFRGLVASTPGAGPALRDERRMCRSVRTRFNFEPPASDDEIRAASLQFVRKLSGMNAPSKANEAAFRRAVDDVNAAAHTLIGSLVTSAEPRNREHEAVKARERSLLRFGPRVR